MELKWWPVSEGAFVLGHVPNQGTLTFNFESLTKQNKKKTNKKFSCYKAGPPNGYTQDEDEPVSSKPIPTPLWHCKEICFSSGQTKLRTVGMKWLLQTSPYTYLQSNSHPLYFTKTSSYSCKVD